MAEDKKAIEPSSETIFLLDNSDCSPGWDLTPMPDIKSAEEIINKSLESNQDYRFKIIVGTELKTAPIAIAIKVVD